MRCAASADYGEQITPDLLIPGARMVHVITVATEGGIDAAVKRLRAVQSMGADLEGLTSSRQGERLDHRLRISGIGTSQASAMVQNIPGLAGIRTASVDHHILTRPPLRQVS
jgi:hypothetical protein